MIENIISTVANNGNENTTTFLQTATFTTVYDEELLYKNLSKQLISIEVTIDFSVNQVEMIREQALGMFQLIDEKKELLIRCDWLLTMKEIEGQLPLLDSLEVIQAAKYQLSKIQTCPLKKKLIQKLVDLEEQFRSIQKQLSPQDVLEEAVFETGNETFINLGIAGRKKVIEEALAGDGKVETAIAKAEELEAKVTSLKNVNSIDEFRQVLQGLPLQYFSTTPSKYEEEVLQYLIDNPYWNGLFQLGLQIKHTATQVQRKHKPVQERAMTTLVVDEKVIELLGVKHL